MGIKTFVRKSIIQWMTFSSYLLPKKRNFWIFYPTHESKGFAGNCRYLALYVQKHHPNIQICIVSRHADVRAEARSLGFKTRSFYHSGLIGSFARAQHVLLDSSFTTFRKGQFSFIQLWHGAGFKNVGLLDDFMPKEKKKIYQNVFSRYRLMISNSPDDQEKKIRSFGAQKTVITGQPRNDILFQTNLTFLQQLKKKYKLDSYRKIITYSPTFRDQPTQEPFTPVFLARLNNWLAEENALFIIKRHPLDFNLEIKQAYDHIWDGSEIFVNLQELLLVTDLLITDYSSVATDYVLTGKPLLIYAYDLSEYLERCRSIYYDLEKILPQPLIRNEDQLWKWLQSEEYCSRENYINSYRLFQKTFNWHLDSQACQRVVTEVFKLPS